MSLYTNFSMPVDIEPRHQYGLPHEFTPRDIRSVNSTLLFKIICRIEEVLGCLFFEMPREVAHVNGPLFRNKIRGDNILMTQLRPAFVLSCCVTDYIWGLGLWDTNSVLPSPHTMQEYIDSYPALAHLIYDSPDYLAYSTTFPRRSPRVKKQREFYYGF